MGAEFVEVEVDTDTGLVTVPNRVSVFDVGRATNPNVVINQMQGAGAHGLGFARSEKPIYDPGTGRFLNPNYYTYGVLTSADDVYVDAEYTETPEPFHPFGCRGIGEAANDPTAGAFANAVYNAIGVRINDGPLSPDKILAALGKT